MSLFLFCLLVYIHSKEKIKYQTLQYVDFKILLKLLFLFFQLNQVVMLIILLLFSPWCFYSNHFPIFKYPAPRPSPEIYKVLKCSSNSPSSRHPTTSPSSGQVPMAYTQGCTQVQHTSQHLSAWLALPFYSMEMITINCTLHFTSVTHYLFSNYSLSCCSTHRE